MSEKNKQNLGLKEAAIIAIGTFTASAIAMTGASILSGRLGGLERPTLGKKPPTEAAKSAIGTAAVPLVIGCEVEGQTEIIPIVEGGEVIVTTTAEHSQAENNLVTLNISQPSLDVFRVYSSIDEPKTVSRIDLLPQRNGIVVGRIAVNESREMVATLAIPPGSPDPFRADVQIEASCINI